MEPTISIDKQMWELFLSQSMKVFWVTIVNIWISFIITTETVTALKSTTLWDKVDFDSCGCNSKAMNVIYNGVIAEKFWRISKYEIAKEAWDFLQITYEGKTTIKISKLHQLTTTFETLEMEDDENFDQFNFKLSDIVNLSFNLGE